MLFWIAIISLIVIIACFLEVSLGIRTLTRLEDISPTGGTFFPKVSVIIPACNEQETIGPALRSILSSAYPNLEVIVINDRSTDNTNQEIKRLQNEFPLLQLVEIKQLPENWLGKSNALQIGAQQASGKYLLFTDADIHMEKSTLCRAMTHMLTTELDHICIIFKNTAPGGLLNALLMDLGVGLLLLFKPWQAKNPQSKNFMGVGAFNLVKASAYRAIKGHSSFAMHPIDDIMLGKVLKQNNFRQECLLGAEFVKVSWYSTVRELINGVMKNTYAMYRYNLLLTLAGSSIVFMLSIFPAWAVFFSTGKTRTLFIAIIVLRICSFGIGFREIGLPVRYAAWSIISPYINCYITIKAAYVTIKNDGINWRGTHYSLKKLKKQPFL